MLRRVLDLFFPRPLRRRRRTLRLESTPRPAGPSNRPTSRSLFRSVAVIRSPRYDDGITIRGSLAINDDGTMARSPKLATFGSIRDAVLASRWRLY
ncbi:MAG: hypothetical protein IT352_15770 [Gemmatimonadales bacterium]|nr:hypothetical protein [Gemmatimonadales bacterium]